MLALATNFHLPKFCWVDWQQTTLFSFYLIVNQTCSLQNVLEFSHIAISHVMAGRIRVIHSEAELIIKLKRTELAKDIQVEKKITKSNDSSILDDIKNRGRS